METFYIVIAFFLICLAVFDLYTGVSSAVVSFLPPAIGAKAGKLRFLLIIAAMGIIVGTATSSGMMDIARHGVLQPENYTYMEVMCVFLSVVCCDVVIIDIFNTLGMPTSTTVSMVFELFGGTTALAVYKMMEHTGEGLTYGTLVNTDKVLSVIIAIFLSVGIAFVVGTIVMWLARVIFTFQYQKHSKWSIALFGGFSFASIMSFLLTKGFGNASFMTEGMRSFLTENTTTITLVLFVVFTIVSQVLHWSKVSVFRLVVIFGTFALAVAFAGNDLVNFIGVAIAGLECTTHFVGSGADPNTFRVDFLSQPATTPLYYLIASGGVMAVALFISKKAHNVINTTINLSRQDSGDEIFSTSRIARQVVRTTLNTTQSVLFFVPRSVKDWINTRFDNKEEETGEDAAAFDMVRASVNLVLSGLLIMVGTAMQLPLSTTYVAFMVAMGSSLADRAWGRDSAVYRITGVFSVVGGWFITAGAAFALCFVVTSIMFFGGPVAMSIVILVVISILIHSNLTFKDKRETDDEQDAIYENMVKSTDKAETLVLLKEHIRLTHCNMLRMAKDCFMQISDGLIYEELKTLRRNDSLLTEKKGEWKRMRQKQLVGMRRIEFIDAVQKNTWFHLASNSITEMIYCLKRMNDPCLEHVDNNFNPLTRDSIDQFIPLRDEVVEMFEKAIEVITTQDYVLVEALLLEGNEIKARLSAVRHNAQINFNKENCNLRKELLYQNTLQETQELVSCLRHHLRGIKRLEE